MQACHSREGGNPEIFVSGSRFAWERCWMPAWRGHDDILPDHSYIYFKKMIPDCWCKRLRRRRLGILCFIWKQRIEKSDKSRKSCLINNLNKESIPFNPRFSMARYRCPNSSAIYTFRAMYPCTARTMNVYRPSAACPWRGFPTVLFPTACHRHRCNRIHRALKRKRHR